MSGKVNSCSIPNTLFVEVIILSTKVQLIVFQFELLCDNELFNNIL